MAAELVDISTTVTQLLTDAEFLTGQTIERAYTPTYKDTETALKVMVIPASVGLDSGGTRGLAAYKPLVWVCVMKRVTRATQIEEVDDLIELVEKTALLLVKRRLTDSGSTVQSVKFDPVYDPAYLDTNDVFQSVIELEIKTFL